MPLPSSVINFKCYYRIKLFAKVSFVSLRNSGRVSQKNYSKTSLIRTPQLRNTRHPDHFLGKNQNFVRINLNSTGSDNSKFPRGAPCWSAPAPPLGSCAHHPASLPRYSHVFTSYPVITPSFECSIYEYLA